jgi:MtN3 and saliva related transmembrane protein
MIDYIGYMAALLTTVSFVPQVFKIYRSKSAKDVSLYMFLLFTMGIVLWLIYGLSQKIWPIIIANTVTLVLSLSILIMKMVYDKRGKTFVQ